MFRDLQLAVGSVSHAAVMPSAAVVRSVIQHMPAHSPQMLSELLLLAKQLYNSYSKGYQQPVQDPQLAPLYIAHYVVKP